MSDEAQLRVLFILRHGSINSCCPDLRPSDGKIEKIREKISQASDQSYHRVFVLHLLSVIDIQFVEREDREDVR